MTLMELLAVLVILSMMLALGAGAWWRMSQSFKEQSAAAQLDVVLRQARNSAITANAPAFVELDTEGLRIVPWAYRTVGLWHFEERSSYGKSTGAYHEAILRGAELFPEGKIGKCVRLREGACVDVGADPDFDCDDGGFLEAYIRPAAYTFTGDNYIFFKKNAYSFKIGRGGVLSGNVGSITVEARTYHIVPGRWTKVALAWDRYATRVLVDDCLIGVGPGSRPPLSDYPLLIGHDTASLEGLVDEVRVMTAVAGNALYLPPGYTITHNAAPWRAVYFAGDGTLDMRYHAGPIAITLTRAERARTVTVSMLGQTTRLEVENVVSKKEAAATAARPAPVNKKLTVYGPDGNPVSQAAESKGKGERKDKDGAQDPAPPKKPDGPKDGAAP